MRCCHRNHLNNWQKIANILLFALAPIIPFWSPFKNWIVSESRQFRFEWSAVVFSWSTNLRREMKRWLLEIKRDKLTRSTYLSGWLNASHASDSVSIWDAVTANSTLSWWIKCLRLEKKIQHGVRLLVRKENSVRIPLLCIWLEIRLVKWRLCK